MRTWGPSGIVWNVLTAVGAVAGAEQLHLPTLAIVGVAAAATLGLMAALGVWDSLVRWMRRLFGDFHHTSDLEAACRALAGAAAELAHLLDAAQDDPWIRRPGLVKTIRRQRAIGQAYRRRCRSRCMGALLQAHTLIEVPPDVLRAAEKPRNIRDLEFLLRWLVSVSGPTDHD